uniref:Uncharacterized protein n=1 Tax=Felis catus TaxID=9685 RepID=A0ABI7W5X9_FELCA
MKEEAFLRRRFSLCPPSSTPQKPDPRKLTRNLVFSGENELYPLGPGKDLEPNGQPLPRDEGPPTPGSATKGPPYNTHSPDLPPYPFLSTQLRVALSAFNSVVPPSPIRDQNFPSSETKLRPIKTLPPPPPPPAPTPTVCFLSLRM